MHDHDLDLIASLADGSLDDQSSARALVETCQQCRQEYESQVSVIGALSRLEPARLTDIEKATLHRDLWTELRGEAVKSRPATPWWYRWSYAAAGLFVMVGLVAVLNQGVFGGEDAATVSDVSGGASAESVAPSYAPMDAEEGAPTTTAAAATEPTEPGVDTTVGVESAGTDFEALATETRLGQLPAADRALLTERASCLSAAGLENYQLEGTVEQEHTYLIAVPAGADLDSETPVTFVDADTCEVVHVEE